MHATNCMIKYNYNCVWYILALLEIVYFLNICIILALRLNHALFYILKIVFEVNNYYYLLDLYTYK